MRFRVMDVGHGFCAYLLDSLGGLTVFDCGRAEGKESPSEHFMRELGKNTIDRLVISHYDEDHISDIPNLERRSIGIRALLLNLSVAPNTLRELKSQDSRGPSSGMDTVLGMMETLPPLSFVPEVPGASIRTCCHEYGKFKDTNNLSLVTFLECQGKVFLLPGDLEKEGWDEHLKIPEFCAALEGVNVYVASHHGRESGYYDKVFALCNPEAIVFSDTCMIYGTQEGMTDKYGKHVESSGRKVYTTRSDGWIEWRWNGLQWTVHTEKGGRS